MSYNRGKEGNDGDLNIIVNFIFFILYKLF